MYTQSHGLQIKFEENTRDASIMIEQASIVSDAILVCMERGGARCDIGAWNDVEEVLVCHEC
jgi:hypothetical protein